MLHQRRPWALLMSRNHNVQVAAYKQLGGDLAVHNGEPSWSRPMPSRYIVGPDGVIAYAEVNFDHTRRPDLEQRLPVIRRVKSSRAA
jgi:hypothetical protein